MNIRSPFIPGNDYTSALNLNVGGIGYANRIEGTGSALDDLFFGIGQVARGVGLNTYLQTLIGAERERLLTSQGWRFLEAVEINQNGTRVQGVKVQRPDGTFGVMLANGDVIPWTTTVQSNTTTINPDTGLSTQTLAMGAAGLVVGGILLYFLLKKK